MRHGARRRRSPVARPGRAAAGSVLAGRGPAPSGEPTGRCATPSTCRPAPERRHWPEWVPRAVRAAFVERGVRQPWSHQAQAAELAHAGRDVVVATGTASGKSLAYQLPVLSTFAADRRAATALYLSPTKALAADQLRALAALGLPDVRAAPFDGDTPLAERDWAAPARAVAVQQPGHAAPLAAAAARPMGRLPAAPALRGARRVPHLPRACSARTWRCCCAACCGSAPATARADDRAGVGDGGGAGRLRARLTGPRRGGRGRRRFAARRARTVALWEPPLLDELTGENGAPVRRSAGAESAGCWPTSSSRAPARWPSSARDAVRS